MGIRRSVPEHSHSCPYTFVRGKATKLGLVYALRETPGTDVLETTTADKLCSFISRNPRTPALKSAISRALKGLRSPDDGIGGEQSFRLIEPFLASFAHLNADSAFDVVCDSEGRLLHAFLAPGPLLKAAGMCLPVVAVDACHIKSKYGGVIVSACVQTGEGEVLMLAIGLSTTENDL